MFQAFRKPDSDESEGGGTYSILGDPTVLSTRWAIIAMMLFGLNGRPFSLR
jgi:hypothetical protein